MAFGRDFSWSQFYQVLPSVSWVVVKFDTHLEGAVDKDKSNLEELISERFYKMSKCWF